MQEAPARVPKPLASALTSAYRLAMTAREAVEHRLASMGPQERIVQRWQENPIGMAAKRYPGRELSSYPVQTRMAREIDKLNRYREELPKRLQEYVSALDAMDRRIRQVYAACERTGTKGSTVPWPHPPAPLTSDPWPKHWPPRLQPDIATTGLSNATAYTFDFTRKLPPPRPADRRAFTREIAGRLVKLEAFYADGIGRFMGALYTYLDGESSSRWEAITEAVRTGIRWPQLDRYLAECATPWLPRDFVDEQFGLRGSLARRDDLAALLSTVSTGAGTWYLSQYPGLKALSEDTLLDVDVDELEQLMAAGLVASGTVMPTDDLLVLVPFGEVRALFALAGLPSPRGYEAAKARFADIVATLGNDYIESWIREYVDPSRFIKVREPCGWSREERLGARARANVMVSTLIMLHEGDPGPEQILTWGA